MKDRRGLLAFLSLFCLSILFVLLSGLLQLRTEQREMLSLLEGQARLLSRYVEDEADWQLTMLDGSTNYPHLLLPQISDTATLDEDIVGELHERIFRQDPPVPEAIPAQNVIILDRRGNALWAKGEVAIDPSSIDAVIKNGTFARVSKDSLVTGFLKEDRIVFLEIKRAELAELRKRHVLKGIAERAGQGMNLLGLNLYDPRGQAFVQRREGSGEAIAFKIPFQSPPLRGYTLEVRFPKTSVLAVQAKTKRVFLTFLSLFLLLGGLFTYFMLRMQVRHERQIREMERRIASEERLASQGRLASGVAHEIRNPLNAIGLSVERLKREFLPKEREDEYVRFLDTIKAEVSRIGRIVEQLLFSTRPLPVKAEVVKVLVDEVAAALREKADGRKVVIENLLDPDLMINCQREKMKQVFFNIIENGIEAIREAGRITIEGGIRDKLVEIHIKDTGQGIRKEDLEKIFEHYFTTKKKGIGLGLSIAYMIVKEHGGDIVVASEEGKGSTFTVRLPWKG
jgi:signal transduction histidine kinase